MNWQRAFILNLVVAAGLSSQPLRAGVENPYAPIVTRNIFGLVPIPTNAPVDPSTLTPPPKITPNGIMTLFGKVQALFKVAGVAHPGQPPKDESYVLCEGDRQDEIEVVKIDEKAATITFNNHGVVQALPLVAGTAVSGGAAPALPAFPTPGLPAPRMGPGGGAPLGFGGRFGRNRPAPSNPAPASPDMGGAPSFGGGNNQAASSANQEQLSPEAQVLMMEASRMETQDAVNQGFMPPLPPTVITPAEATAAGGSPLIAPNAELPPPK